MQALSKTRRRTTAIATILSKFAFEGNHRHLAKVARPVLVNITSGISRDAPLAKPSTVADAAPEHVLHRSSSCVRCALLQDLVTLQDACKC
eukprot:2201370-Amphidinium_carterae.1